ncbi:MAG TPA: hypothetical protein VGJ05_21260 [Fimbriiglobus sp.]|jgi:hypothetical protein
MRQKLVGSWVVYQLSIKGKPEMMRAVCEESEWEAMERDRPGVFTLIQSGITNEGEAERLARGTSGDRPERSHQSKKPSAPLESLLLPPVAETPLVVAD